MDTTKKLALREQFEAAYVAAYPTSSTLDSALFHREGDGQYERVQVQTAWTLYCAALSTPAATIQPSLKVAAADAPTMLNGLTADETSSTASVDGLASAPEPTDQQWQSIVNDAWMALPESVREAASADAGADHPLAVGVRMALAAPEPVALTDAREREAFEREMRCEEEWGHVSLTRYKSGGYKNTRTASMWSAWKSRAALAASPSAPVEAQAVLEWRMVCGDWRDELVAVHGPSGHIASGLTIDQAKALINAHGGSAEAVAWRCKDRAGDWLVFQNEKQALGYQTATGCLMQTLYITPAASGGAQAVPEKFDPSASHIPPDYRDGWNNAIDAVNAARRADKGSLNKALAEIRRDETATPAIQRMSFDAAAPTPSKGEA